MLIGACEGCPTKQINSVLLLYVGRGRKDVAGVGQKKKPLDELFIPHAILLYLIKSESQTFNPIRMNVMNC